MGFCLFNNNAITARHALRNHGLERVLIVDWDAHHGNGIQDIFYAERDVLYISTHQYPHYPGSGFVTEVGSGDGEGFTVNFPFPAGTGEKAYLRAFDEVIIPVARQYRPDLFLVSAGYDGHFSDPLCSMLLTSGSYRSMAERLVGLAEELCGGRMIVALEGGYNLMGLAASVAATVAALVGVELDLQEEVPSRQALDTDRGLDVVDAARSALSPYWDLP
jgi:acetoin utilization deacetylase AcuC-like enzyme